nr:PKD domain-containing protein [Bacteroidota bacterium]
MATTLTPAFSSSTYVEYWRIWIDYNRDGDFEDTGEEVYAPASSSAVINGNFTVDAAATGKTRMRVTMKWNGVPTPCEAFSYGEVEDYMVNFVSLDPPVADFTADVTTVTEGGIVQFTDLSTNNPTSWAWTFAGGTPGSSGSQNPSITYNVAGTYNVSLTATNSGGSDAEVKNNYITVVALPECAALNAPANGATDVLRNINLEWAAATDATGYKIYFGTDNPPTNIENGTNLGNVLLYNPSGDLAYNTVYYWKIVAYNAYGDATGCATWNYTTEAEPVLTPECASLVAPANGSSDVAVSIDLDWTSVTGADGYKIFFGTNNPPTNIENGADLGNVTLYNPFGDLAYTTTYYWQIIAYNTGGDATGCATWPFTTEDQPSGPVELLYTDFEDGFGLWTDGGGDCALYTSGTYAAGGNNAGNIQDNSGVVSSFYLTNGIDIHTPGYIQLDIEFDFIAISMDNSNEDFWVQYFDGTTWHTVATYAQTIDFVNATFYSKTVTILEGEYTFPTDMKIRFMCDASANADDVYIDEIRILASSIMA